jgi:predicted  nucleic acid-binding Zn-ribbon protein
MQARIFEHNEEIAKLTREQDTLTSEIATVDAEYTASSTEVDSLEMKSVSLRAEFNRRSANLQDELTARDDAISRAEEDKTYAPTLLWFYTLFSQYVVM